MWIYSILATSQKTSMGIHTHTTASWFNPLLSQVEERTIRVKMQKEKNKQVSTNPWKTSDKNPKIPNNFLTTSGGCGDAQLIFGSPGQYGLEYPGGHLSQLCPLQTSGDPTVHSLVGQGGRQEKPWHCASTQQELKYSCAVNTAFSTCPKHSPLLATVKKNNSIPVKTSTKNKIVNYETEKERSVKQLPSLG